MSSAALIAYPLSFTVYPYRIESAQDVAAFGTNTEDGLKAVTAKNIFGAVFGMLPDGGILCLMTEITCFHLYPFRKKTLLI